MEDLNIRLEWDSKHNISKNTPYWEKGTVVHFHTKDAQKNEELEQIRLSLKKTYAAEEFVVTHISKINTESSNTHQFWITLTAVNESFIADTTRRIEIMWPSSITKIACYLRKIDRLTIKISPATGEMIKL